MTTATQPAGCRERISAHLAAIESRSPWTCVCGATNTTIRCKHPDHDAGLAWRQHVEAMQAREATLPPAPAPAMQAREATLPPAPAPAIAPDEGCKATCAGCAEKRWLPATGIHCVECLAKGAPPGRKWSNREEWILGGMYGLARPPEIQDALYRETGVARTRAAVIVRAGVRGLDHRTNHGGWTVRQAAEMAGVTTYIVYEAIERGDVKAYGRGKCRVLDDAAIGRLRELYPDVPFARTMSRPEMMRRLGYSETHASRLLLSGAIRAIRRGGRWYVDADHVAEIERELRESGAIRRSLMDVPALDASREYARNFARTLRRQRRQEARQTTWMTQQDARQAPGVGRDQMRALLEAGLVRGRRENDLWLAERSHVAWLATRPDLLAECLEAIR